MFSKRFSLQNLLFKTVLSFGLSSLSPVFAGLDKYTELDNFDNWLIERKFDSERNKIFCRASMPKYGSWFGSRVRLDEDDKVFIPEELAIFKLPNAFPLEKLQKSLMACRESLIYTPQSDE